MTILYKAPKIRGEKYKSLMESLKMLDVFLLFCMCYSMIMITFVSEYLCLMKNYLNNN